MASRMQAPNELNRDGAAPEAILHPGSRRLFAYWNRLRGERGAPGRQEIDLRAISAILPWVGIIECCNRSRRHNWRLVGTGIARLWGGGLTGMEVAADWPEVYRSALVRALDGIRDQSQPFVARLKAVSANGEAVGIEIFAVPVDAGRTSMQTLCTVSPFRSPPWLGRVPLVDVELSSLTAIWLGPLPDEIRCGRGRLRSASGFRLIRGGRSD